MKKAKIFLSAIAIFAVVGGAIAFKAKNPTGLWYTYTTTTGGVGVCNLTNTALTDVNSGGLTPTTFVGTTDPQATCTITEQAFIID